jgi:uncharacterized protein YeaO (DUF488 family)
VKRREAHLIKMERYPPPGITDTDADVKLWRDHVANVRRVMRFPDGPPKAKRVRKKQ